MSQRRESPVTLKQALAPGALVPIQAALGHTAAAARAQDCPCSVRHCTI